GYRSRRLDDPFDLGRGVLAVREIERKRNLDRAVDDLEPAPLLQIMRRRDVAQRAGGLRYDRCRPTGVLPDPQVRRIADRKRFRDQLMRRARWLADQQHRLVGATDLPPFLDLAAEQAGKLRLRQALDRIGRMDNELHIGIADVFAGKLFDLDTAGLLFVPARR